MVISIPEKKLYMRLAVIEIGIPAFTMRLARYTESLRNDASPTAHSFTGHWSTVFISIGCNVVIDEQTENVRQDHAPRLSLARHCCESVRELWRRTDHQCHGRVIGNLASPEPVDLKRSSVFKTFSSMDLSLRDDFATNVLSTILKII